MSLTLTHSQANIIRWLLINLGLGTDPASAGSWPIYAYSEPDTPDAVITVYNTVGFVDGRAMPTGEVYEHFGFQVRVRATSSKLGITKINEIARQMAESVHNLTVTIDTETYTVCAITRKSGVIELGKEYPTSERNVFTLNAIVALYRTV
jgi:hypothetical protein